jgi:uncharacterized protein YwqG
VTDFDDPLTRYRARLNAAGLGEWADTLCEAALPGIRLVAAKRIVAAATGVSRLGGSADLPADVPWPTDDDGAPLSFIAQLDLRQMAAHDVQGLLPRGGMLSFFYAAIGLSPEAELTFTPWESSTLDGLGMTRGELDAYADVLPSGDGAAHRLLGHPDPLQGDMQLECQLVPHGLYCGDASGSRDPRAARLRPGAADWRLLLQVDSQDETGMMWGDVGRLYYWIRREDLAVGDWDGTWLILQCC